MDFSQFSEERYPKRNRKNKIENLSSLDEPEYINKAEKLTKLAYNIDEILNAPEYKHDGVVRTIPVEEFTLDYIKQTGLSTPLFFNEPPERLGMRMPDPRNFTVDDVLECIGGNRKIEVVEVFEQSGRLMKLSEFVDYYKKNPKERNELLNVLSLEFTSTKLAEIVSAPSFVTEIDWIDTIWPKELFVRQENLLKNNSWAREHDFSTYPKVQRYCLMSVANCFTDYHIDFGGTSVWYHILKGEKVFWLIEPTEENLKLYEEWIKGGSNNTCFFGKIVNKCARIHLQQGNTLIIPSGWIHCVYTPCDSIVFGGNFLHSHAIPMQIRISRSEDRIKVGSKYRFPHFKQIFWCYLAKLIRCATGRTYQKPLSEEAHNPPTKIKVEPTSVDESPANPNGTDCEEHHHPTEDLVPEDENIFYDNIGNAEDGKYTYNPIQQNFSSSTTEDYQAPLEYDIDYLNSLSPFEINGLHSLIGFMKRLLKKNSRNSPEVIEGISRPYHLVLELEQLLKKLGNMNLLNLTRAYEFCPKSTEIEGFAESLFRESCIERAEINLKLPSKKKFANKRPNAVTNDKKAAKLTKPALVDGLPLPTNLSQSFESSSELFKLGHKPIPTAWRKSSQMAKPPLSVELQQFKKNSATNMNNRNEQDMANELQSTTEFDESMQSGSVQNEKKNICRRNKIRFIQRPSARLVERHDDDSFTHRSPLACMALAQKGTQQSEKWKSPETVPAKSVQSASRNDYQQQEEERTERNRQWHQKNNYNNNAYYGGGRQRSHSNHFSQNWRDSNNGFSNFSERRRTTDDESARDRDSGRQSCTYENSASSMSAENEKEKSPDDMEIDDMDIEADQFEEMASHPHQQIQPEPTVSAFMPQQQVEHIPLPVNQPMSTAVNELHQISQSMNFSSLLLDEIPLPPSPQLAQNNSSTGASKTVAEKGQNDEKEASKCPFQEVDELAELGSQFDT